MVAAVHELLQGAECIAADRNAFDVEGEFLIGELPGGVVVLERHFGAGNAVVVRLDT